MKYCFLLIFLFFSIQIIANSAADSTNNTWQFHGNIQINNNGISPVPAFSLGKPALMTTLTLTKKLFTYSPEINYGFDGKPWTINQWFRFRFGKQKFTYGVGAAASLFFGREKTPTSETLKLNQYLPLEASLGYKFSEKVSVNLNYWNSHGLDSGSVKKGHFIILSGSFSHIKLSNSMNLTIRPNLFYLVNDIPFEGIFCSAIASISHKNLPFSVFTQVVQPLKTVPDSKFNWNYGLNYTF